MTWYEKRVAYLGYSRNLFCIQTKVYSLYKPAHWSHISIHIVQKPRESSHSIICSKLATQYSNVHLLFLIFIYQIEIQLHCTTYIRSWCIPPPPALLSFFLLSLSLSLFPLLPIFVPPYSYFMYPLRVVMLSNFAYSVDPLVWCFRLVTLFDIIFFWNV